MAGELHLRHPAHTGTVGSAMIFFPFESGRFGYDCVSCGSYCCRGHGYSATISAELAQQIGARRLLPLFINQDGPASSEYRVVGNLPPACFFLADDGKCQVHAEHGYSAKPETCRLFPFNFFLRAGPFIVVAPHPSLCPLRVIPHGSLSEQSSHDSLSAAMISGGISMPVQKAGLISDDYEPVIELERAVVAAAALRGAVNDLAGFLDDQVRLAARDTSELSRSRASLAAVDGYLTAILGTSALGAPADSTALDATLIACSSLVRAQLVLNPGSAADGAVAPFPLARVPHALLGLYHVAHAAAAVGMQGASYQTVMRIFRDFGSLVELLAFSDSVVSWCGQAPIDLRGIETESARRAVLAVAAAVVQSDRKVRPSIGTTLLECLPQEPIERIHVLKTVSHRLARRVAPIGETRVPPARPALNRRMAGRLQRLLLRNVEEPALLAMYDRLALLSGSGKH